MQDVLGHDNDTTTTQRCLGDLALQPVTSEIQRTIGVVMGWQARDHIEVGRALRKQWHRFAATRRSGLAGLAAPDFREGLRRRGRLCFAVSEPDAS